MALTRHEILPSIRTTTLDGVSMAADPTSFVDQHVLRDGYYEPEVTEAILVHLPAGGVFWDIGANSGVHSLAVAHERSDATVIAFEPSPSTFTRLLHNIALNGKAFEARCHALGAEPGYSELHMSITGHTGISSLRPLPGAGYSTRIPCRVERGDDLIVDGLRAPDVVKVDVEGFEHEVLRGMPKALEHCVAVLFEGYDGTPEALAPLLVDFDVDRVKGRSFEWLAVRR